MPERFVSMSIEEYRHYLATGSVGRPALKPAAQVKEEAFLQEVRALAKRNGWLVYHTHDSRGSEHGYPDCCFCDGKRVIYAELKIPPRKATKEQATWLSHLRRAGVEAYLWYPAMWAEIVQVLSGEQAPALPKKKGHRRASRAHR